MRIAIEELEDLKELNDELEENHLETEKQLEEEIGRLLLPLFLFNVDKPNLGFVPSRHPRITL